MVLFPELNVYNNGIFQKESRYFNGTAICADMPNGGAVISVSNNFCTLFREHNFKIFSF